MWPRRRPEGDGDPFSLLADMAAGGWPGVDGDGSGLAVDVAVIPPPTTASPFRPKIQARQRYCQQLIDKRMLGAADDGDVGSLIHPIESMASESPAGGEVCDDPPALLHDSAGVKQGASHPQARPSVVVLPDKRDVAKVEAAGCLASMLPFIASGEYKGPRRCMCFKWGELGLGYYWDAVQEQAAIDKLSPVGAT